MQQAADCFKTSTGALRWVGEICRDSPTLGLTVPEGLPKTALYHAEAGHDTYSHHGFIASHRGVLYASWSNHARDEDASGQHVRFSLSRDGGASWLPAAGLFPPHDCVRNRAEMDVTRDRILIPNGFAEAGGMLYAVALAHVLEGPRGFGRLARSIGSDGTLGDIFWLVENPPEPVPGFPAYPGAGDPAYAEAADAINTWLAHPEHWASWEFLHHTCTIQADDGRALCEPTTAWHLPGGGMARLWRDLTCETGCQYVQFSDDGGATWAAPIRSEFPDAYSRTAAGNLPDGTAYIINNPVPRRRDPLVISLAADGLNFDRHAVIAHGAPPRCYEGVSKNLGFQYPHAVLTGDMLWVIYSVNKEDIEVAGIALDVLNNL